MSDKTFWRIDIYGMGDEYGFHQDRAEYFETLRDARQWVKVHYESLIKGHEWDKRHKTHWVCVNPEAKRYVNLTKCRIKADSEKARLNSAVEFVENFSDYSSTNAKVLAASYSWNGREIWVRVAGVINRKTGELPHLVGLNAGHYTAWYLVYVDASFVRHNDYEAVNVMADFAPELIQCEADEYHENDISYYGNNSIPVYAETIRAVYPAKRVNYHADNQYLFEGSYTFPKDRKA